MGNKNIQEITIKGIFFFRGDCLSNKHTISFVWCLLFLMGSVFPLCFNCQEREERDGLQIVRNSIDRDKKF